MVVNDASVLIDLLDMDLFTSYLELNWEMITSDLIVEELIGDARFIRVRALLGESKLKIEVLDSLALPFVAAMSNDHPALSLEDCSVWFLAKQKNAVLLTTDQRLRRQAKSDGVEVHGSLFVVQALLKHGIINQVMARQALRKLADTNPRAPLSEIDRLLRQLDLE